MGWWSATIMGGDTPLDYEGDLYGIAGLSWEDTNGESGMSEKKVNKAVAKSLKKMVKYAKSDEVYDSEIMKQVLGVLVMRHAVPVKDAKKALELAVDGAENDEWAAEGDDERRGYINAFIKQLKEYDGTAQEPAYEGLFQKMFEKMS